MKITRVLRSDCPSGIDCDRVYDTDSDDLAVQGRTLIAATLGLDAPAPGRSVVLIVRHLLSDAVPADLGVDQIAEAGDVDLAVRGRAVPDPTALGIRTPPPHEAVVLVSRALLPGLSVPVTG